MHIKSQVFEGAVAAVVLAASQACLASVVTTLTLLPGSAGNVTGNAGTSAPGFGSGSWAAPGSGGGSKNRRQKKARRSGLGRAKIAGKKSPTEVGLSRSLQQLGQCSDCCQNLSNVRRRFFCFLEALFQRIKRF